MTFATIRHACERANETASFAPGAEAHRERGGGADSQGDRRPSRDRQCKHVPRQGVQKRRLIDAGVTLAINTDAHSVAELRFMRWGVDQARRGWAERKNVLNTKSLDQVLKRLAK